MEILGKLIIIGGAVDKGSFTETNLDKDAAKNLNFFETGILKRIIQESKNKEQSRIEVITTASKIPREIGPEYVKAFSYLGANNADVLYIEKREQANDPEVLERLKAADIVMFTGFRRNSFCRFVDFKIQIHRIYLCRYIGRRSSSFK